MNEKTSVYSQPEAPVRHSYPLAIQEAGLGQAITLFVRTLPYAIMRFGVLLLFSAVTMVWFILTDQPRMG